MGKVLGVSMAAPTSLGASSPERHALTHAIQGRLSAARAGEVKTELERLAQEIRSAMGVGGPEMMTPTIINLPDNGRQ